MLRSSAHRGRGGQVVAPDVSDAHREVAARQRERVVPVATDLQPARSGQVPGLDLHTGVARGRLSIAFCSASDTSRLCWNDHRGLHGGRGARAELRDERQVVLGVGRAVTARDEQQRRRHRAADHHGATSRELAPTARPHRRCACGARHIGVGTEGTSTTTGAAVRAQRAIG